MLPEGERCINRSVRHYRNHVDGDLRAEVDNLSKQEAFHSREHNDYNRALVKLGYPAEEMERRLRDDIRRIDHPRKALAITCAIEHFATTLADSVLRHPKVIENGAEPFRTLWLWHSVEELEHSAVALDVLNVVTAHWSPLKRYAFRIACFNATAKKMIYFWFRNVADYARADGVQPGVKFWARMFWVLYVNPGLARRALPTFLSYYKPGFKATLQYDQTTIDSWRTYIDGPEGISLHSA
jgi:predicted metal-dependent hydrolase